MGCSPSQAVIVQSTKTENAHLHPTIFMVNEKSLQMLRELGELNFYHLARYNEAEDTAETIHHDFAAQLENPMQYSRSERSTSHSKVDERLQSCQVEERSTCKVQADYVIHVQRHGTELNKGSLTSPAGDEISQNFTENSDAEKRGASDSPVLLSVNTLKQAAIKNTGRSSNFPHIRLEHQMKSQNSGVLPTTEATTHAQPSDLCKDSHPKVNATLSRKTDPLDEIISVVGNDTPAVQTDEGSTTAKSKAKTFGRNRIMPKRGVSEKYEAMKSESKS